MVGELLISSIILLTVQVPARAELHRPELDIRIRSGMSLSELESSLRIDSEACPPSRNSQFERLFQCARLPGQILKVEFIPDTHGNWKVVKWETSRQSPNIRFHPLASRQNEARQKMKIGMPFQSALRELRIWAFADMPVYMGHRTSGTFHSELTPTTPIYMVTDSRSRVVKWGFVELNDKHCCVRLSGGQLTSKI